LAIGLVSAALLLAGKASWAQELVAYNIVDEISIPKPLTDQPGDPVKGREVAINRKKGNCLACHVMPIPEQSFHGEIGPDLTGVGSRYKIGELRLRVVDPKTLNPDTMMPAFYRNDGFHRVAKKFEGKTILGPQEVEDLLAYLMSLRDG
jgi:sulfur-oxidizing protein SoxX